MLPGTCGRHAYCPTWLLQNLQYLRLKENQVERLQVTLNLSLARYMSIVTPRRSVLMWGYPLSD
jgi:hypothetical protein